MKKSEKLFMLINKIDENIIAEAKPEAQKANKIIIEKHGFPIKETVAAAACFAVLAGGIFAAFKFRLNNPDPLDSNVGNSLSSGISLAADAELDDILRALEPGFEVYDWFFDGITGTEEHRFYFGDDDLYGEVYYPVPENFPQSYDGLEELVNKYFTEYTAGVFMKYVCRAENISKRPAGAFTVTVEDKGRAQNNKNPIFIEANGKLYGSYIGRGSLGVPDIGNAKIKTRTETAIGFSLGRTRDGEELYSDETVKFENGGWRLDYYMPWLDQNDDMELRNILKDLVPAAEDIDRMFLIHSIVDGSPDLVYWANQNSPFYYYLIPEGTKTEPNGLFEIPQSYEEIEKLASEYFSKRTLEGFKMCMGKGKFNENGELEYIGNYKGETFIEADGKMYRRDEAVEEYTGTNLGIDIDTAKVTRKTDKTIEFTYMGYCYPQLYDGGLDYAKRAGSLSYEDGKWKLDYYPGSGFKSELPNDYSDEDLELQAILEDLRPGDTLKLLFASNSVPAKGDVYNFMLMRNMNADDTYHQYIDVSEPQPEGWQKQPKSLDELEKMLLEYFTEESTAELMSNTCKGKMTANGDGTYNITLDKDLTFPVYIEIDGKMFYRFAGDPDASSNGKAYNTEKVVYKADNIIKYSYIYNGSETRTDLIKYERGGWKFAPYEADPELTYEPNKEILGDLGLTYDQLVEKRGKLVTNTYKGVLFENGIGVYGWKYEGMGDFFVDNDHTNPGKLPDAGGCNILSGIYSEDLLTNFSYPLTCEKLCERYGFTLVSKGDEYGNYGYIAVFTHPLYPGVEFSSTSEEDNEIGYHTVWWIQRIN